MKDVYYPSQEPEGRVTNERYDLVGMRSQSRHGSGATRFHQGTFIALWATKYPVRNSEHTDYLPTQWVVSRHNEDTQDHEELVRVTDKKEARHCFDALMEEFPQSDLPLFEKVQGRPSQGRSHRLQATITDEQLSWLEAEKVKRGFKSVSDVVFSLIEEAQQAHSFV